jgi:RHS repeat-associated protein
MGAWSTASAAPGYWGTEFHYSAAGSGADTITWTPALTTAGSYRVYARWTYNTNRATNAPYTVHHTAGSTTLRVNQEQNGGEWVPLGSFDLAPGQNHRVVLSDDANEYVIGDAVKFVLETNARAVVADAIKIVGESAPAGDFAATASNLTREYVTLDGRPLALIENGQIQYVHPDHLGTPQKMTDSNGALVWDAVYRPFGEAESITGSATNPQRFPGQVYDPETGFHYNYFRDYAPGLGRYVESDPIGLLGGLNTYGYVSNNPLIYTDPRGLILNNSCYWGWMVGLGSSYCIAVNIVCLPLGGVGTVVCSAIVTTGCFYLLHNALTELCDCDLETCSGACEGIDECEDC